jgi:hypothetical protein
MDNKERTMDTLKFYDLEQYLFNDVRNSFHEEGYLSTFDFFTIVIWKANRAKSTVAGRLRKRGELDIVVRELTSKLYSAPNGKERLRVLVTDFGFRLPMATAILTVLWPDEFTVYDIRVCDSLGDFHKLGGQSKFDRIWNGYEEFVDAVRNAAPSDLSLRDKDRYLWAKDMKAQLEKDLIRWDQPNS